MKTEFTNEQPASMYLKVGLWLLGIILAVGIAVSLTMHFGSNEESREDLNGQWEGVSNDGYEFEAVIVEDYISIDLNINGIEGLYWDGELTLPREIRSGDPILSYPNIEKLEMSLYGSMSDRKTFVYEDGYILFDFQIMGTTREVALEEIE